MHPATRIIVLALALFTPAGASAETLFRCSFGTHEVTVTRDDGRLSYRYGRPGRPELTLGGDAASGNLFYHRTLYARGEDQTLRFVTATSPR